MLTEDQLLIRNFVSGYLQNRLDDGERRRIRESRNGWGGEHWRAFAEDLGILGIGFASKFGGLGGMAEMAVVAEQLGAALFSEPYLSTVAICGAVLRRAGSEDPAGIIGRIIAGEAILAFAHGEPGSRYDPAHVATRAVRQGGDYMIDGQKSVVLAAPWATHLVLAARTSGEDRDRNGLSLFLVDADAAGITRRDFTTISGNRASEIELRGVRVPTSALLGEEGAALPLIEEALDVGAAMICVEAVGVMTRLHGDTLAHVKQRQQFGRPLAGFQVVQHRLVDMLIAIEHSASIAARAVSMLELPDKERAMAVSAAKVHVGKALRLVGQQSVQLHGAMGLSDELALGFFFKRAIEIERQFGTVNHHLARYERLGNADV